LSDTNPVGPHLRTEARSGALIVTLDVPAKRNALTGEVRAGLAEAIQLFGGDDSLHTMVLTGAGTVFCSGADLESVEQITDGPAALIDMARRPVRTGWVSGFDIPLLFAELDKPTVAALNGPAIGAGLGLALCCDIRIAVDTAFLDPGFVRLGLAPEYGMSYVLPRLCGLSVATEILVTGRRLSAAESVTAGLISRTVAPTALLEEALAISDRVSALPLSAVRRATQALRRSAESPGLREQVEYEAYLQTLSFAGRDDRRRRDRLRAHHP
jgi:enoyl-CoA hydratase/carnithine racemase